MATDTTLVDLQVDVDRGFRQWHISEIYIPGNAGTGTYVPNPNDLVLDYTQGWLRVISVDYTTGVSIREPWSPPTAGGVSDEDALLGSGPGYQSESWRCFLNTAVTPFTLTCDSRLHKYGAHNRYIKIFRGTDITNSGQVISAFYDQSGAFLGEDIPMEVVGMREVDNVAIMTPKVGYTSIRLNDGDVVTVVAYSDAGHQTSIDKLIVRNSAFVRSTSDSMKYVQAISIESTFLSPSDPQVLMFPINQLVNNINMTGVVTYSDGSQIRLPVDGTKFQMDGLNEYVATVVGQRVPLVLHYYLSPSEYSYIVSPSMNDHISVDYEAVTTSVNGSAGVKLYCIPVWVDVLNGYRLEYYLYNLLREQWYNVTNVIQMGSESVVFNPTLYGTAQHLAVAVNLKQVDALFADWRHVQTLTVSLKAPGSDTTVENWEVVYTPGQNPPSGLGTKALAHFVNVNNWQVDLTCGALSQAEWLAKVYYPQQPLVDDSTEIEAPVPNFLLIRSGAYEVEIPITQWNTVMQMADVPAQGHPVYLHFMRRNAGTDLQLAVAGLITHRV
jgi:hypothetical protein